MEKKKMFGKEYKDLRMNQKHYKNNKKKILKKKIIKKNKF